MGMTTVEVSSPRFSSSPPSPQRLSWSMPKDSRLWSSPARSMAVKSPGTAKISLPISIGAVRS